MKAKKVNPSEIISALKAVLEDTKMELRDSRAATDKLLGDKLRLKQELAAEGIKHGRIVMRTELRIDALTWALQLAQMAARDAQEALWDEQAKTSGAFKVEPGDKLAVAS